MQKFFILAWYKKSKLLFFKYFYPPAIHATYHSTFPIILFTLFMVLLCLCLCSSLSFCRFPLLWFLFFLLVLLFLFYFFYFILITLFLFFLFAFFSHRSISFSFFFSFFLFSLSRSLTNCSFRQMTHLWPTRKTFSNGESEICRKSKKI